MTNRDLFKLTYASLLEAHHKKNPEHYAWPISELGTVLGRINMAIDKGSFSKNSQAFRKTCVALKIKYTYQAIETFIGEE